MYYSAIQSGISFGLFFAGAMPAAFALLVGGAAATVLRLPTAPAVGASNLPIPRSDRHQVKLIHEDPPVYTIPDFLSADECTSLIAAAESGALEEVDYGDEVVIRWDRLVPPLVPLHALATAGLCE